MSHSVGELTETVHQRVRLGTLSGLTKSRRADFGYLRDALEVTNGNLSKHPQVVEAAGYVSIEKTFADRRPAPRSRPPKRVALLSPARLRRFELWSTA